MKFYKEIIFTEPDAASREVLMAQLSDLGYDGFEEEGDTLKAYINNDAYDALAVDALAEERKLEFRVNTIQERNWNAEWESSFSPVVVEDKVAIRAHFHEPVPGVAHEIIITPKMSFGTGHHATTWLMLKHMLELDFTGKTVLDLGTGTGVLAILAERLGAEEILAIDNDEWSVDNARENLGLNGSAKIRVELGNKTPSDQTFDVVLANINKHILLAFCDDICKVLKINGRLLLSGVLREDLDDIRSAYGVHLGEPVVVEERNNWLVVGYKR